MMVIILLEKIIGLCALEFLSLHTLHFTHSLHLVQLQYT